MSAIKNVIARLRYAAGQVDLKLADDAEAELASMQARIEKLETAASNAVAWLHHYQSPDDIEEQTEYNRHQAVNILEKALKGDK